MLCPELREDTNDRGPFSFNILCKMQAGIRLLGHYLEACLIPESKYFSQTNYFPF